MGNIFSRRRPSPSPTSSPKPSRSSTEHQLCPLHQRLKCLKDLLSRFKPNVETSRDALRKDLQALSDECSKLLTSIAWHPTPEELKAISSLAVDTAYLAERLRDFSDRRLELTSDKIDELSAQIDAESGDVEALTAALQKEIDCSKTPGATTTTGTSRWITLLKKFGSMLRDVAIFLEKNAMLEASLVHSIETGNVFGATVEGIELAASACSNAHHASGPTPTDVAVHQSECQSAQKAPSASASEPEHKIDLKDALEEPKPEDSSHSDVKSHSEPEPEAKSASTESTNVPAESHQTESAHSPDSEAKHVADCELQVQTDTFIPEAVAPVVETVEPAAEAAAVCTEAPKEVSPEVPAAAAADTHPQSPDAPAAQAAPMESPTDAPDVAAPSSPEEQKSSPEEATAVSTADHKEEAEAPENPPAEPVETATDAASGAPPPVNECLATAKENSEPTLTSSADTADAKPEGASEVPQRERASEEEKTQEQSGAEPASASEKQPDDSCATAAALAETREQVGADGDKENQPQPQEPAPEQSGEAAQAENAEKPVSPPEPETHSVAGEQPEQQAAGGEATHSQ